MSRIDDLISELAPTGVQFKPLGEFAELIRGNSMPRTDFTDQGVGAIHYGQIYTYYGAWATSTISFVAPETAAKLARVEPGDLIITNTSENLEDVGKAVAWLGAESIVTGGHATVIKHHEDPKYLSYWFQSESFSKQKKGLATGTKVIDVSAKQLAKVRVPLPPLQLQREIARVLDQFADAATELESLLDSEREARHVQHQHGRRVILESGTSSARVVSLSAVADLIVGFAFKSSQFSSDVAHTALLRGDNIGQGFLKKKDFKRWRRMPGDGLDTYHLQAGDVVLAMDRPWIPAGLKWAQVSDGDLPALLVQRVARLRAHSDVLDPRFLGCIISSPAFTEHVLIVQTGNTVPHLSGAQIGAFEFRLPPLSEQISTVVRLEKLDSSGRDLSAGLVAEVSARRTQYIHYRDRLLTFAEAVA